ncbi:MAG: hypothetical protein JXB23_07075 [Candidatus Aminicenantes bacterium]|nr:hypothetical protein [Candidatus Aminicenantes bacterium]
MVASPHSEPASVVRFRVSFGTVSAEGDAQVRTKAETPRHPAEMSKTFIGATRHYIRQAILGTIEWNHEKGSTTTIRDWRKGRPTASAEVPFLNLTEAGQGDATLAGYGESDLVPVCISYDDKGATAQIEPKGSSHMPSNCVPGTKSAPDANQNCTSTTSEAGRDEKEGNIQCLCPICKKELFLQKPYKKIICPFCNNEILIQEGRAPESRTDALQSLSGKELKRIFDFDTLRGHLRSAGIGSLVWGVLFLWGLSLLQENSLSVVVLLLGLGMIVGGLWVLVVIKPHGLIIDGLIMMAVGILNIYITTNILERHQSSEEAVLYFFLGWIQLFWGIGSISRYKRYAYLRGRKPKADEVEQAKKQIKAIWEEDLSGSPDLVGFKSFKSFFHFSEYEWRVKLLPAELVLLREQSPFRVLTKSRAKLRFTEKKEGHDPLKAKLRFNRLSLRVLISRRSFDLLRQWRTE